MQRANLARGHLHTCCVVVTSSCGFKVRSDAVEPWSSNWECVPHLSPNDQCHNMYQTQTILIVGGWAGCYPFSLSAIHTEPISITKGKPHFGVSKHHLRHFLWSGFEWNEKIFPIQPAELHPLLWASEWLKRSFLIRLNGISTSESVPVIVVEWKVNEWTTV